MGYTIGDVLTVIGFVVGAYVSTWALMVGCALAFPRRAERAEAHLRSAPWVCLVLGAALYVLGGFFTVILLNLHNPITTLLGWLSAATLIAMMVVGGSGLALVLAERIQQMDRRCPSYRALARGAAIMVIAGILPLFGWLVAAVTTVAALGAGFQAVLFARARHASIRPPVYAGPVPPVDSANTPEV